jgi:hypothetical protein
VFFCGCETWFVTLRKAIGPQRDDVTGGLDKWHIEELHNFYWLQNIIRTKNERPRNNLAGMQKFPVVLE